VTEPNDRDDDLRATYGPDETPPPEPEPDADEPAAEEPVIDWDTAADAAFEQPFAMPPAPPPEPETPEPETAEPETAEQEIPEADTPEAETPEAEPDEPEPEREERARSHSRRDLAAAALAAALVVLFFVPWFIADGLLASSGAGLVAWTEGFLAEQPGNAFRGALLVPYLALLIPAGALVVLALALRRRPHRVLAIGTALVAPLLLAYAWVRDGTTIFKVLDVGAYLTLVASIGLLVVALLGTWTRRVRGFLTGALAVLVVAAFIIPSVAEGAVDSPYFAAFAAGTHTLPRRSHPRARPDSGTSAVAATTTTTIAEAALPDETTTTAAPGSSTTAVVVERGATGGCPSGRPVAEVTRFSSQQESPGSTRWVVDVEGQVITRASAAADVSSVSFVVLQGSTQVGGDTVPAGRTLAANASLNWWSRGLVVESPGGAPNDAQITNLAYAWNDGSLSACAR
jgi:hypothetical protein